MKVSLFGIFTLIFLAGCVAGGNHLTKGTVELVDLEGGFYGIVDETGNRYDPEHLPESFRKDGLRVRFKPIPSENLMSTRMWGQPIKLEAIEEA